MVVDNASTDGTQAWLAAQPGVDAVLNDDNLGVGAGHNLGWARARALLPDVAFIWALEHDTVPEPGCLERLLATAASQVKAAAVVPAQTLPGEAAPGAGGAVAPHHALTFNGTLFRVEAIDAAGPVREDFVVGHEDREYAWRLRQAGWAVLKDRGAHVEHRNKGARRRGRPSVSRAYYSNRNEAYLIVQVRHDRFGRVLVLGRTAAGVVRAAGSGDHRVARMRARVRATLDGLGGDLGWKHYGFLEPGP